MTVGERIKQRRLDLGLSADAIADALGKNRATIYRYESNDIGKLPINILEPLAKALKTTPAYLMGWLDEAFDEKKDAVSDIFVRLKKDPLFFETVQELNTVTDSQLEVIKNMILTFKQN